MLKRRRATIKANDPIESSMAGIVIACLILHQIDHDERCDDDNLGQESIISSKSLILHLTPIFILRNVFSIGHALI